MGCHYLLQGDLSSPESEPVSLMSPALEGRFNTNRTTLVYFNVKKKKKMGFRSSEILSCIAYPLCDHQPPEWLHTISQSVQSLSHVQLFVIPWTEACQASCPSSTPGANSISCPLSRWCQPTICRSHLPPSIFPKFRIFSRESVLHNRWPNYWSFWFSISPSSEYSGLISFRMDWLDLLAIQGTLKSLLQHNNSKASILQCSAFFKVQLSHLNYWKNHSFD